MRETGLWSVVGTMKIEGGHLDLTSRCFRVVFLVLRIFLSILMEFDANNDDEPLDASLCVICEQKNEEKLVEKPSSYEKTWNSIKEWASYGESTYLKSWAKLQSLSPEDLQKKNYMGQKLL